MDLELNRVDYCFVGPTLINSMKLLPSRYKEQQKVVVGDQDGVLQLFSIKKDEPVMHFKTLPTEKIQCVQLGGAVGTISDKIFVASDNKIRAYNKKGKMFLTFDTNLTEPIKSMFVTGNDLILCGNHVYNHYRDCKDIGTYLCGDTIVDVVALNLNNTNRIMTALACSGRVLRLLEHCRVRQSIELESVPTILHVPKGTDDRIICGMADGRVALFQINPFANNFTKETLLKNVENSNAVTAIDTYDVTGDGKMELIIGRRDGTIQVFSLPNDDNMLDADARLIFNENFNESITSIQGGCVRCNGYTEVVACTYVGRIFGLSTQCIKVSISDNAENSLPVDLKGRIDKLREEINELELKVQKERDRYKLSTQTMSTGLSAIPMLPINSSLNLSNEDALYLLSIETSAPIEFVLLQSNIYLKLLDVEKSTAVVSFSKCDSTAGNCLLATYRCQIDKNRVDLKFRTVEGQHGILQAFITPNIQPKVSQLQQYPIKPLSLHMRVYSFNTTRPHNQLTLKGAFSHAEIHNWISNCIPEVPDKLQIIQGEKSILYFKNVFIETELMCEYCKGEAHFKTENISTVSILKDFLTKEATKKHVKLEISNEASSQSVAFLIKLIEPKLVLHTLLRKDYNTLMTLIDLDIENGNDFSSLGEEYAEILLRKNDIIKAFGNAPLILDRLIALITELYTDYNKMKGTNAKLKIPELITIINEYNYKTLISFLIGENID